MTLYIKIDKHRHVVLCHWISVCPLTGLDLASIAIDCRTLPTRAPQWITKRPPHDSVESDFGHNPNALAGSKRRLV